MRRTPRWSAGSARWWWRSPGEEATLAILRALKPGLERHHHLRISEEAVKEAVRLSRRYLPDLYLPDKAIDLLDEGAARARMEEMQLSRGGPARKELEQELNEAVRERKFEKAAELRDKMQHLSKPADGKRARCVTGADIAWVVSARTGIPVGRLTAGERERLLGLEGLLSAQVVGRAKLISAVAEAVRRATAAPGRVAAHCCACCSRDPPAWERRSCAGRWRRRSTAAGTP